MSHRKIAEESYQVPIWVITFSDMTTNLLTFFVLLLSMGHMRDETLFDEGRALTYIGAVRRAFKFKEISDFGNIKIKYYIPGEGDMFEGRTIDAREEDIRRLFKGISRSMKTMPSQIVAEKTNFMVTDIRFSGDDSRLNESAKKFLIEFCDGLQKDFDARGINLYVLGLAAEERSEKQQWIVSAKRAQAVADFLKDTLRAGAVSGVYSWGGGAGGKWVSQESLISKQSQILIAVLRQND